MLTPNDVAVRSGVTPTTVRNWLTVGVPLPDGRRVRLRAERHGCRWRVDESALAEFVAACTAAALPPEVDEVPVGCPIMDKSDRREYEAAQKRLKLLGL